MLLSDDRRPRTSRAAVSTVLLAIHGVPAAAEFGIADALRESAKAAGLSGETFRANALYEECARHAERIGDHWNHAVALNNLGDLALNEGEWERAIELCSASRDARLRLGDLWGAALTLSNVAVAEFNLGRAAEAERDFRQALGESLEAKSITMIVMTLEGCAAAVAQVQPREATRIVGSAAAIREEHELRFDPLEQRLHESTVAVLQAALGPDAFAQEYDEGSSMTAEQAGQFALDMELET